MRSMRGMYGKYTLRVGVGVEHNVFGVWCIDYCYGRRDGYRMYLLYCIVRVLYHDLGEVEKLRSICRSPRPSLAEQCPLPLPVSLPHYSDVVTVRDIDPLLDPPESHRAGRRPVPLPAARLHRVKAPMRDGRTRSNGCGDPIRPLCRPGGDKGRSHRNREGQEARCEDHSTPGRGVGAGSGTALEPEGSLPAHSLLAGGRAARAGEMGTAEAEGDT